MAACETEDIADEVADLSLRILRASVEMGGITEICAMIKVG